MFRGCLVAHTLKIKYGEAESVALFYVEKLIKAADMFEDPIRRLLKQF